jgi:hypothetical protein
MKAMIVLAAAAAVAASSAEHLSPHRADGFKLGYKAADAEQSIREYVPAGESVEDWSRMITDQRFIGLLSHASPAQFAVVLEKALKTNCPGARTTKPIKIEIDGRKAAQMRGDCPRNPSTGKPETFYVLLIAGESDLHSRQVAWRRFPSRDDVIWAEDMLARTRLCSGGKKAQGC